jgi:ubiquinone/menaquinone biosynthesis C-methylase UbiE
VDRQAHWEKVYSEKAVTSVSWYRPHLETSLELIDRFVATKGAAILDIGGGASTLVDDLLAAGYENVSVLDIADEALEASRVRLGDAAERVKWMAADFLEATLEDQAYDLCHDRAVFHFLNAAEEKVAYFKQARRVLRPNGVLILATFALDGPPRCSGLEVSRYDEAELTKVIGDSFELFESRRDSHVTPAGSEQKMMYFVLRKSTSPS